MIRAQNVTQTADVATSQDQREIDGFSALADTWWDTDGPFAPLHKLNPARIRLIVDLCATHFSQKPSLSRPFQSKSLWDVGCGGGLVAEPLARLGFSVTGMDASSENIMAAQTHAQQSGLSIEYLVGSPEELPTKQRQFDVVLALEVVEHVADIQTFVSGLTNHLAPGGLVIFSTINRSLKSMALAKVAAEYLLRWVPAGTHTWSKFVKPSELSRHLRNADLEVTALKGLNYNLATGEWSEDDDVSVNYVLAATTVSP